MAKHGSEKRGFRISRRVVLVATAFAIIATACSWFLLPAHPDNENHLHDLWLVVHLPALLAYIGTLGEHDPWKGNGFFPFVFIQWFVLCFFIHWFVVSMELGLLVGEVRRIIRSYVDRHKP